MTEPDSILSLPKRRHRHKSTHLQKAKLGTLTTKLKRILSCIALHLRFAPHFQLLFVLFIVRLKCHWLKLPHYSHGCLGPSLLDVVIDALRVINNFLS